MGELIDLTAADGHSLSAYQAKPQGRTRGALVIIQEIFGVNEHIRRVCDDFASEGYHTIAPALFDRVLRNTELGYTPDDVARGREIRADARWDDAVLDVAAALDTPGPGDVAVVGYCWGGSMAWLAATRLKPAAAVCYYGGQIIDFAKEQPGCPVMMHFGEQDSAIPMTDVESIQREQVGVEVFTWPAGHGFNCDARASYDAECASQARKHTLNFLRANLQS